MSHRLASLHWQRMLMLHKACTFTFSQPACRLQRQQLQHLIGSERLTFWLCTVATSRQKATPALLVLFAGRLNHLSAAAGTCSSCLILALLLLPPLFYPDEQPGVRNQGSRIYKQPGTGTQEPCCFCWFGRCLGVCLVSVKQPGSGPTYPKRQRPPSPFYLVLWAIVSVFRVPWSAGFLE